MADSESGSPDSSFLVTIGLSLLVLDIFACDRQTDGRTNGQRGPPRCGGPANNRVLDGSFTYECKFYTRRSSLQNVQESTGQRFGVGLLDSKI